MDPLLALALGLAVAPFAIPLTLVVTQRFGLVGGTPRELMAVQLELERKKVSVEEFRLEVAREELAIRKERQAHELKIKMAEAEARTRTAAVGPRTVNPALGLRG